MKWWGPVGLIAGAVLIWFGFDFVQRAIHLGWNHYLPHLTVGICAFVAVVSLVNARRFGRS